MLTRPLAALGGLALVASLVLTGCGDDGSDATATDPAPTTAGSPTGVACDYPSDGRGAAKEVDPPPASATVSGAVPVEISTSAGDLAITLDADAAPCTVNSFVSLAEQGYFDDTDCHRLTTAASGISVLQCGDPTGTGAGGPGYSFADEVSGSETYPAGTVAMANAGPDTNGSQFFLVYGDTPLPASYTVFGKLDPASLKVVRAIGAKGTADGGADGAPAEPVTIESVTAR